MRCPRLLELPTVSDDRQGWPWTQEADRLPDRMPSGQEWPKVTIVTPSYNQGQYIEATIRSVLLQGYPNMEYMILDAGSTDNSVEIIRKYEPWLSYWVSQPDKGQSDAINQGWRRSTGEILAWLNSDDYYYPSAIELGVRTLQEHSQVDFVYGRCDIVDAHGRYLSTVGGWSYDQIGQLGDSCSKITQPTTFVRREPAFRVGLLDESFHQAMDYDLWLRLGCHAPALQIEQTLAAWRFYPDIKSLKYESLTVAEIARANKKLRRSPDASRNVRAAARKAHIRGIGMLANIAFSEHRYGRGLWLMLQTCGRPVETVKVVFRAIRHTARSLFGNKDLDEIRP